MTMHLNGSIFAKPEARLKAEKGESQNTDHPVPLKEKVLSTKCALWRAVCLVAHTDINANSHFNIPYARLASAAVLNAKAPKAEGKSLESFLASLAVASAVFLVEITLYILLRWRLPSL